MKHHVSEQRVREHLEVLATHVGARPPGSPANRRATTHVERVARAAGASVEALPFEATWWEPGPASVVLQRRTIELQPSPFSRACSVRDRVVRAACLDDLGRLPEGSGRILVLAGALSASPVFPKAFPFVSLPDQQELIARIEAFEPAAVVAVAPDDDVVEPVFEDGDLGFPYVTVPAGLGSLFEPGTEVSLSIGGRLRMGAGVNLTASFGANPPVLVSAHVDSKVTTPGALDNGASVAGLLALLETGRSAIDGTAFVFFNGEDQYAAPGEQAWLRAHDPGDYRLAINLDGIGLASYPSSVCTMAAPAELEALVAHHAARTEAVVIGPPWYESDHAVFAMRGIPTIALTTAAPFDLLKRRSHASDDSVDAIDVGRVAETIDWLAELLAALRGTAFRPTIAGDAGDRRGATPDLVVGG